MYLCMHQTAYIHLLYINGNDHKLLFLFVKRYEERKAEIRSYTVRRPKIKMYAVRKREGHDTI